MTSTLRRELERKALHVTSVSAPLAYAAGLTRRTMLVALATLLAAAVLVELARHRHALVQERFAQLTGRLLRAHEHTRWAGATWLLLSFTLAVLLLPRDIAIAAMWGVSVGDAAAAIIGRWAGRRATLRSERQATGDPIHATSGKTMSGSIACAIATFAGALFVARLPVDQACAAAIFGAAAERPAIRIDDNLRIVVAVGFGIVLWRMIFS